MFDKEGNTDIKHAESAIHAWCSVPDKVGKAGIKKTNEYFNSINFKLRC